ncbi:hypothetical protein C8J57DRAFT_1715849 [Mycena rebaudengoi]|nr:hypothetical protein C8J57DRAFT_1715849 [Mycena rebaudengoi]
MTNTTIYATTLPHRHPPAASTPRFAFLCFPLLPSSIVHSGQRKPSGAAPERIFLYMYLVGSAVSGVLIAAAMTYLVRLVSLPFASPITSILIQLMNTAEPGTHHHAVKRVVRLIVQTNSLTASVAIVGAILFSVSVRLPSLLPIHPTQLLQITQHPAYNVLPLPVSSLSSHFSLASPSHPVFHRMLILPKLYANTLLLVLNNRASPNRTAPQPAVEQQNRLRRARRRADEGDVTSTPGPRVAVI